MCTWWPSIVCTCATASTYAFPTLSVTVTLCPVEDMRTNAMIRFPTVLPVGNVTDTDPTPDPSIAFDCTRSETGAGAVTVSRVVPLTLPTVAVIVVGPGARVVAAPVALIVATVVADELHVAVAVKSAVVPSLFVPVAANCCSVPFATEGFAGVTAIETRDGAVTVSVAVPCTVPEAAVIVVGPGVRVVAPPVALIVATLVAEELHVAVAVKSAVVPSPYVPVAVNCCGVPFTTEGFAGVTAIETSDGPVTVSSVVPLTLPTVAVIVVGPGARVVAAPVALIVATVVADELHVAVKSAVVPSLYVPLAVNCCGVPFTTEGFTGVTARDVSTGTLAGLNVAKTAVQLVLGLTLNVAAYAPVEVTATASLPARDVFVSCCNIVYPLPAVTVPV